VAEAKIAVIDINSAIFASEPAQARVKQAIESADFVALKAKLEGASADFQALAKEAESKRLDLVTGRGRSPSEENGVRKGRC
jgi:hypothetical protein